MNKSELVAIRDAQPEDLNFIMATWLRGMYYGESWLSSMKKQDFMKSYHSVIEFTLRNPSTRVTVACLKDDPSVILGYAFLSTASKAVHWVFIKKSWRAIGLAKDLVPGDFNAATNLTKVGSAIVKKKEWAFNPFLP